MSLKQIDREILNETTNKARRSERRRMNYNFHELSDKVQRMLNAIEPESYIAPHRHLSPPKSEFFVIIKGRGAVFLFDDAGAIIECRVLEPAGDVSGVEFAPGQWHSIVSLKSGTVFFEVKNGPYIALSDKDFAPWAPTPGETEAAQEYTEKLRAHALSIGCK